MLSLNETAIVLDFEEGFAVDLQYRWALDQCVSPGNNLGHSPSLM